MIPWILFESTDSYITCAKVDQRDLIVPSLMPACTKEIPNSHQGRKSVKGLLSNWSEGLASLPSQAVQFVPHLPILLRQCLPRRKHTKVHLPPPFEGSALVSVATDPRRYVPQQQRPLTLMILSHLRCAPLFWMRRHEC